MLSFKADINAVDVKRETPLSKAARAGMVDAVAALLAAGANIEVRDMEGRFAGESFSHKASRSEDRGILHIRRRLDRIRALSLALALLMACCEYRPMNGTAALCTTLTYQVRWL